MLLLNTQTLKNAYKKKLKEKCKRQRILIDTVIFILLFHFCTFQKQKSFTNYACRNVFTVTCNKVLLSVLYLFVWSLVCRVVFWITRVKLCKNIASLQCNDSNKQYRNKKYRNLDTDKLSVFEKPDFEFWVRIFGLKFGGVTFLDSRLRSSSLIF